MILRRAALALAACLLALPALAGSAAVHVSPAGLLRSPGWVLPLNPDYQVDFARGVGWRGTGSGGGAVVPAETLITVTRATPAGATATNLLPDSPAGFPYAQFVPNQLVSSPPLGALIFDARTNFLLNSTAPATQTTGSLANGTYTLWVNGTGSATMSAGTATGCGTGVATQGTPVNFTTTGAAGTCTVTVAGSLNAFQLELGDFGSPLIITAGATATRAVDAVTVAGLPSIAATFSMVGSGYGPTSSTATRNLFALGDGTLSNFMSLSRAATTNLVIGNYTVAGVGKSVSPVAPAWTSGLYGVAAGRAESSNHMLAFNGGLGGANAQAGTFTVTAGKIGARSNGSVTWNYILSGVTIYPRVGLSDSVLRDLSELRR